MKDLKEENPSQKRLKLYQKHHKEILRWLRQAFKWSGLQTLCKSKHRLKRGVYECGYCGNELGPKQFEIDHEKPCIAISENPTTGYNYTEIIERMFDENNLVLSCIPCHRQKTGRENSQRKKGVPLSVEHTNAIKDSWTEQMKLQRSVDRGKEIICIQTGKTYHSAAEAARLHNINVANIQECANMRLRSAGGFNWKWADEENYIIKQDNQKKKIKCVETGEIFQSITEAAKQLNIKTPTSISNNLSGLSKKCKGLTFEYVEEE